MTVLYFHCCYPNWHIQQWNKLLKTCLLSYFLPNSYLLSIVSRVLFLKHRLNLKHYILQKLLMNLVTSQKSTICYKLLMGKGGRGIMQDDVLQSGHCFTESQEIVEWYVCLFVQMGCLWNSLFIDIILQSKLW